MKSIKIFDGKYLNHKIPHTKAIKITLFVMICIGACLNIYLCGSMWNELKKILENEHHILFIVQLFIINCPLSLLHEFGHAFLGKMIHLEFEGIFIKKKGIFPFMVLQVSEHTMNKLNTNSIDSCWFYFGGVASDCILGGIFSGIYLKLGYPVILPIVYLCLLRIIINLLPMGNSDGHKILMRVKKTSV